MSDHKPRPGDRVRVTTEGEVSWVSAAGAFEVGRDDQAVYFKPGNQPSVVSIEKIEPPVTVFKPGQTVRGKRSGLLYSLGEGGFWSHTYNKFYQTGGDPRFTSKSYELVDLK